MISQLMGRHCSYIGVVVNWQPVLRLLQLLLMLGAAFLIQFIVRLLSIYMYLLHSNDVESKSVGNLWFVNNLLFIVIIFIQIVFVWAHLRARLRANPRSKPFAFGPICIIIAPRCQLADNEGFEGLQTCKKVIMHYFWLLIAIVNAFSLHLYSISLSRPKAWD